MKYLVAVAIALSASPAIALETPTPVGKGADVNTHVQEAPYIKGEQVLVVGSVGRSVTIMVAPDESIRRAVLESRIGEDGKAFNPWQGPDAKELQQQPLGNVLPLWCIAAGRSTAQVITGPDNAVYQLLLVCLPPQPQSCPKPDCDDPTITTGLTFTYAAKAKVVDQKAAIEARAVAQNKAAEARLKTAHFYGTPNWSYIAQGEPAAVKRLAPDQIYDQSQATVLRYAGNREVPAVFVAAPGVKERTVTLSPQKDLFVLYEVIPACTSFPKHLETCTSLRLRSGGEANGVVNIYNTGKETIGDNPHTGTISPDVQRVVRTAP